MRCELKKYAGKEIFVSATIGKIGNRMVGGYIPAPTVLLTDVKLSTGQLLAKHLWLRHGGFAKHMKFGTKVSFNATVIGYKRGQLTQDDTEFNNNSDGDLDYTLTNVTRIMAFRPVST